MITKSLNQNRFFENLSTIAFNNKTTFIIIATTMIIGLGTLFFGSRDPKTAESVMTRSDYLGPNGRNV